jgi:hypothetical protein
MRGGNPISLKFDFGVNQHAMKKILLFLFALPSVLQAQILPNLFSPYRLPDSKFRVDTIHFHQGALQIDEYSIDASDNESLVVIHHWQTKDGRFIKSSRTFPNNSGYNYYESQFEYDSLGRPFQLHNFRRLKDQTFLEPSGKDSLVFEASLLRFDYRVTGNQNPGYFIEYLYDSVFGAKASYVRDHPNNTTFSGMYEVQSFYKPDLPSFALDFSDSKTNRKLMGNRQFSFDSLDRLIFMIDSSIVLNNMRLHAYINLVYLGNTRLLDSIIFDEVILNAYHVYKIEYDANQKVSQIKVFRSSSTLPLRLEGRLDFVNPSSNVLDQTETKPKFGLYPNPAGKVLNIQSEQQIETVEVYQTNGVLVLQQNLANANTIDISDLNAGMYLVKITTSKGIGYSNFIKLP